MRTTPNCPKSSPLLVRRLALVCSVPLVPFLLPAQDNADEGEVFELSPFTVDASKDTGYYSSQTLAGGRLNTNLKDIASSVQVVTKEFMEDVGATSLDEVFAYTTGTEAFGSMSDYQQLAQGGNDDQQGATDLGNSTARQNPEAATRVRGMAAPTRTTDYFASDIPFDSYNSSRIDINRGANSFLFGLGSPGGIVNTGLEGANLNKDSAKIDVRLSTENFENNFSDEISVSVNKVLIDDKLAVRLAAKEKNSEFMQKPAFTDQSRRYVAVKFKPFAERQITFKANYESGDTEFISVERNGPLETLSTFIDNPLGDTFGPVGNIPNAAQRYILDGFGNTVNNQLGTRSYLGLDANGDILNFNVYNNNFVKRNGWMPVYDGTENADGLPTRATDTGWTNNRIRQGSPTWDPDRNLGGTVANPYRFANNSLQFATNIKLGGLGTQAVASGGKDYTNYVNQGLLNYDVIDFRKNLITGSNDLNSNDFDRHILSFEAVSKSGNYGVSVDYASENYDSSGFSLSGSPRIDIDINYSLPVGPNDLFGPTNPNFGRLYIYASAAARTERSTEREAARATAFGKFDFKDKFEGGALSWFGRHTVSGLVDSSEVIERRVVKKPLVSGNDAEWHISADAQVFQRQSSAIFYISEPYLNAFEDPSFSMADFHTAGVDPRARVDIPDGFKIPLVYKSEGNPLTQANRNTVVGDEYTAYGEYTSRFDATDGYLNRTKSESQALNLQSFFLNDLLIANLGWRTDKVDLKRTQAERDAVNLPILDPSQFNLDNVASLVSEKSNFGYGLVLRAPSSWLREGMSLSAHYGENSNFVAVPGQFDFEGNTVPNQSGNSKDYGVTLGLKNDKFVIRFNAYEANIKDEDYTATSASYLQLVNIKSREYGALWVALDEYDQNRDGVFDLQPDPLNPGSFIDVDVNRNGIQDAFEGNGLDYMTLAQFSQLVDNYEPLWNDFIKGQLQYVFTPKSAAELSSYSSVQVQSTVLSDTVDLEAKGYEVELTWNPTRNLRLAFNGSETTAQRSNIAPRMGYLIDQLIGIFESVPNAARLTNSGNPLETALAAADFDETTLTGSALNNQGKNYFIAKALSGSDTPELAKYSFNLLGNYTFSEGRIKGFNTGAAYRWSDKSAIGYPLGKDETGRFDVGDVTRPYYGDTTDYADIWFGYRRKIFGDRVDWRAQLNVRNVFADSDPVAIQAQPDGSIARVSIPVPRQFVLSNTFSF